MSNKLFETGKRELSKAVFISEVSLEEIESLEETVTPGFGIVCGNSCFGFGCW